MLELEHAAKSFQQKKECIDALSLTSIFSYNDINEFTKDLKVCENVNSEIGLQFRILKYSLKKLHLFSCITSILHYLIFGCLFLLILISEFEYS